MERKHVLFVQILRHRLAHTQTAHFAWLADIYRIEFFLRSIKTKIPIFAPIFILNPLLENRMKQQMNYQYFYLDNNKSNRSYIWLSIGCWLKTLNRFTEINSRFIHQLN